MHRRKRDDEVLGGGAGAAAAPAAGGAPRTVHIVRAGESPYTISRAFGVSLDALLQANGLTRRSRIKPGQAIRIPSAN